MKRNPGISVFLTLILPLSLAVAQTPASERDGSENNVSSSITAARCQYTPDDPACAGSNDLGPAGTDEDRDTLAQLPHRAGPRMRPRGPSQYPRSYPRTWGAGDRRHVVIGAALGLGLGAAIGAKAGARQPADVAVKTSLGVGAIGSLIGAAIGAGVPAYRARNQRMRGPWSGPRRERKRR